MAASPVCSTSRSTSTSRRFGSRRLERAKRPIPTREESHMKFETDRRGALMGLGAGLVLSGLTQTGTVNAASGPSLEPVGATSLRQLTQTLAALPRRRDFKTRPMIPDSPEVWDAAALNAVLSYKGGAKQAWDNTDLTGP